MRKIVILIIILAYLHSYFGCVSTTTRAYAPSELTKTNKASITVITHDLKSVIFDASTYSVKNDTLYGQVLHSVAGNGEKQRWIKIALRDIKNVTGTERHVSTLTYIIWGTVVSFMIIIFVWGKRNSPNPSSSGGQWSM